MRQCRKHWFISGKERESLSSSEVAAFNIEIDALISLNTLLEKNNDKDYIEIYNSY